MHDKGKWIEIAMTKKNIINKFIIFILLCFAMLKPQIVVDAYDQTPLFDEYNNEDAELLFQNNDNEVFRTDSQTKIDALINILSSILIEIIGAFLGFLSAIAFANRSNKHQMKELDSSLYGELKKIYDELKDRLASQELNDYYCYQTMIWDISLASGTLALVANSKIYKKYIQIYSMIQYAQELEAEYIHAKLIESVCGKESFVNSYIFTIGNARRREANNICEHIKKYILEDNVKCQEKI